MDRLSVASSSPLTGRKQPLLELLCFLFLIVPSMVLSFFTAVETAGFNLLAWSTIVRDLALVSLIAYFLWRNGEPVIAIGWTLRHAAREISIGLVLFIPMTIGTAYLESWLRIIGFSGTSTSMQRQLTPAGPAQVALAVLLVTVVAIAEETIFRGYIILRLRSITGSLIAAVLLSAGIFCVGHGYEGTAGVLTVAATGVVLAVVYLWRRSLLAPIVMHFLQDFISIVALPLLMHKH